MKLIIVLIGLPIIHIKNIIKGIYKSLFRMKKNPNFSNNLKKLEPRSAEQTAELEQIERKAISNFYGPFGQLTSALGMLRLGHHLGWRALYIIYSKRTIRNYEEILNIKIRELFVEEGPIADRSMGYWLAKKFNNFWKVVSGDIKVDNRTDMSD